MLLLLPFLSFLPSWVIALVVGLVIIVVARKLVSGSSSRVNRNCAPSTLDILHATLNFRGYNFEKNLADHERLFAEARKTGDHAAVTANFYDLMGRLIAMYYGENWHFAAPSRKGQSRTEAIRSLHHLIARLLQLAPGKKALDIGSGMGGIMHDMVRYSGANFTGLTISTEEVDMGNKEFVRTGLDTQCHIVKGDMQEMKDFADSSFDCAYAVYSFKYLTKLDRVLTQTHRVLKPGGLLLVYDIIKTPKYDQKNPEHVKIVSDFEYSCGMPPLHTQPEMVKEASRLGFECVTQMTTDKDGHWYWEFDNAFFQWALTSNLVQVIFQILETIGITPRGFRKFFKTYIVGNVMGIVRGGQKGILSGGTVLVFRKRTA